MKGALRDLKTVMSRSLRSEFPGAVGSPGHRGGSVRAKAAGIASAWEGGASNPGQVWKRKLGRLVWAGLDVAPERLVEQEG